MGYSKQRESILQAVLASGLHPTADDVYVSLKPRDPNLSLGTVYRNLNYLESIGKIKKISLADHPDRFDGSLHEHQHMMCSGCGKVVDVDARFPGGAPHIQPPKGWIPEGYSLLFYGKCACCADQSDLRTP
ncbi:MAG: transcriptional repressor [Bacillota bacterium]